MIEIYILDKELNLLGLIEKYSSLRWLEEFNGLDEFELIADSSNENTELIAEDNIVWKNDTEASMIIEKITIKDNKITARGRGFKKQLSERIVLNQLDIKNIELGLRKMISDNAMVGERKINFLSLGPIKNYTDSTESQFTYKYLDEVISEFADFGYTISLDIENKNQILDFYKGNDLSKTIVFSEDFENIIENSINLDNKDYKNFAIIGGQGEGINRTIVLFDRILSNENRRELWVDAKDISKTYQDENGTEKEYTNAQYKELLISRGIEKLNEHVRLNNFQTKLILNSNYTYKQDFNLGDLVTVKNKEYKIELKARINSTQEVYEDGGYTIYMTLGND